MEILPLKPERKALLDEYARRHGQDPVAALDTVPAKALEWDQQDFEESVEHARRGYEDTKARRTKPVENVHQALRRKHGFPA